MSNYLTVEELKASKDTQGNTIDTSNYTDTELQDIINRWEEYIERICKDKFYSFDATYYFDGTGKRVLFFPPKVPYKLLSVTSVKEVDFNKTDVLETYDENEDFLNGGHYIEMNVNTDFRRLIGKGGVFPKGQENIEVVGSWGWENTPKAIKRAVQLLCMEEVQPGSTGMTRWGERRIQWDDYEVEFSTNLFRDKRSLTGYLDVDRLIRPYVNYSYFMFSPT